MKWPCGTLLGLALCPCRRSDVDLIPGAGGGSFPPPKQIANGACSSPVVGDFNGDGIPDPAMAFRFSNVPEAISVFEGKGEGTFQPPSLYGSGLSLFGLMAGEFNGDGRTDLAAIEDGQPDLILGNADIANSVTLASSSPSPVYPQPIIPTATLTPALSIGSVTIIDNSGYPPFQQTTSVQNGIAGFALTLNAGFPAFQAELRSSRKCGYGYETTHCARTVAIPQLPSGDASVTVSVEGMQSQAHKFIPIQ